jgi:hypothetical protein
MDSFALQLDKIVLIQLKSEQLSQQLGLFHCLREIGWDGVDSIDYGSGQGPVEGSCEHGIEPSGSINC